MIQRSDVPKSVVTRVGGVSRRVRVGQRFTVPSLGGEITVEVAGIESVSHSSEHDGWSWNSWRPVLRTVPQALKESTT